MSIRSILTLHARQAYRGKDGTYTIRKHRPIFYGEFINDEKMRRRYWARSYLGQFLRATRVANPLSRADLHSEWDRVSACAESGK